ncbi:hypothetical protein LTR56_021421 [Elasticomyces elasticus]|nr:hypothetical protein LTR56_021421 [Elasticomyces elasticus]KAK3624675.1 hypothetical protein LTR22_023869 [Elasticomyces elasticus]KAK4907146.1 hypothetical protein LTR49_023793 [Elasticomyces elasticus]KAK5754288.1 hypothetical protein LTS12_015579 [Elasticomyces elasticus]
MKMEMTAFGLPCFLLHFFLLLLTAHARDVLGQNVNTYHNVQALELTNYVTDGTSFVSAECNGRKHLEKLAAGSHDQSTLFNSRLALIDNGWTNNPDGGVPALRDGNPSRDGVERSLPEDAIEVYEWLNIPTSPKSNALYAWIQNAGTGVLKKAYGAGYPIGFRYAKTPATYQNQINAVAGMIMCKFNYGPAYEIAKNPELGLAPPLSRLSDVLWLQWKDAVKAHGTFPPDFGSVSLPPLAFPPVHCYVIGAEIYMLTLKTDQQHQQELVGWPGKTYRMDGPDEEGEIARALLGSHNGNVGVYFLGQHLDAIKKKKTFSKVTLWGNDGPDSNHYDRNLLFYVVNV